MCKAIKGLIEREKAIGEERGIAIGEERGIAIGEERGIAIGEKRGVDIMAGMVKDGIVTLAEAAKRYQMTEAQFLALANGLQ